MKFSALSQRSAANCFYKLSVSHLSTCIAIAMMCSSVAYAQEQLTETEGVTKLPIISIKAQNKTPASVTVMNRDKLDQNGVTDMASIVKYMPLVSAPQAVSGSGNAWDGSGTTGYNIRGVDGNRVGLDVDGIDIAAAAVQPDSYKNNSYSLGRDYIEPEMFSEVRITEGTSGAESDGIGGRVSFKTKSPDDYLTPEKSAYAAYKAGYSSADEAWLNAVTAAIGNEDLKVLLAYAHRQGHETQSEGELDENPASWQSDAVLTRLLWQLNEQHRFGFTFDYYKKDSDRFLSSDLLSSLYPQGGNQNALVERTRYSLDHVYEPQNFILFDQLTSQLSYQESSNQVRNHLYYSGVSGAGYRTQTNRFEDENFQFKADAKKYWRNHHISYGLAANKLNNNRPWTQINVNGSTTTQNRMVNSTTDKYSLYLKDDIAFKLNDRTLMLTPGLRAEYQRFKPKNTDEVVTSSSEAAASIHKNDYDYVSPSLALSYELSPRYYSYVKYNRGARIPTANELAGTFDNSGTYYSYSIVGNSDLKKETSNAFELGFKTHPIDGLQLNVTGFYTNYKNFIDYQQLDTPFSTTTGTQTFSYQATNLAKAKIWGGEVLLRANLGEFFQKSDGFSVTLAAGKTKAQSENAEGEKGGINSVQPEKASLTLAYDDPQKRYGFGFVTTAVGDRLASQDSSVASTNVGSYTEVPGYTVFDLNAYWQVNRFAKVNLSLNNLFDKKYWQYATVGTLTESNLIDRATMPGRNVVASVEFKY